MNKLRSRKHNNNNLEQSLLQSYFFRSALYCIFFLVITINLNHIRISVRNESINQISNITDFATSSFQNDNDYIKNVNINDSILCGGCFFSKTSKDGTTCGHYIRQHVLQSLFNSSNISDTGQENEREKWFKIEQMQIYNKTEYMQIVRKAAIQISYDFPHVCSQCHPSACYKRAKNGTVISSGTIYHPYDVAAPKIQQSWSHYLNSIPAKHRYPLYGIDNVDEFLSHSENRKPSYFFEYNPSIVVIPEHERQQSFTHPTTSKVTYPVYLASYRVSQSFWCIARHQIRKIEDKNRLEWTGLAYLDENFVVLAEGIYDFQVEDVRLVSLPSPHLKQQQQIYLTYSSPQHLYKSNNTGKKERVILALQRELWLNKPDTKVGCLTKQPLFIDNETQTMPPIYVRSTANCFTITDAAIYGKNVVYFEDATITSQTMSHLVVDGVNFTTTNVTTPVVVAETWPPQDDSTHKVAFVELQKSKWCPGPWSVRVTDGEMVSGNQYLTNMTSPIQPSFYTIEEEWFGENLISHTEPWNIDRGSACCIEMIDPRTNQKVLVGISHAKIISDRRNHYMMLSDNKYKSMILSGHISYLSRFYAFEATRPYRTVALSGHFCWPLITSTVGENNNQFENKGEKLVYIKSTNQTGIGWCPKIHFVMSLLYKVNSNKSSVIVALGVNDCTPRLIEILTSDISDLLFYGSSQK